MQVKIYLLSLFVVAHSMSLVAWDATNLSNIQKLQDSAPLELKKKNDAFCGEVSANDNGGHLKEEVESLIKNFDITIPYLLSYGTMVRVTEQNSPRIHKMVKRCCDNLNMSMPGIFVFKGNFLTWIAEHFEILDIRCNAFAWSLPKIGGFICIGEDLAKNLAHDELEAVVAHELCHIFHNHIAKRVVMSVLLMYLLWSCIGEVPYDLCPLSSMIEEFYSLPCAEISITAIFELFANAWYSRRNEKEADVSAIKIIEKPEALGQALDSMGVISENKPRFLKWLVNTFSGTHPLVWERKNYMNCEIEKIKETNLALE